jgi:hypothetical protein
MLNVVLLGVVAPKPFHYWLQLFRQKIVEIMEKKFDFRGIYISPAFIQKWPQMLATVTVC